MTPVPVLALLARLGWAPDPHAWTVPCRDQHGQRASLRIGVHPAGITLTPSTPGTLTVEPLPAGRLRAGLRDALLTFDALASQYREPAA